MNFGIFSKFVFNAIGVSNYSAPLQTEKSPLSIDWSSLTVD